MQSNNIEYILYCTLGTTRRYHKYGVSKAFSEARRIIMFYICLKCRFETMDDPAANPLPLFLTLCSAGNTGLRSLNIGSNNIGDKGAVVLAEALKVIYSLYVFVACSVYSWVYY